MTRRRLQQMGDRLIEHGFLGGADFLAWDEVIALGLCVERDLKIAALTVENVLAAPLGLANLMLAAAPGTTLVLGGVGMLREMEPLGGRFRRVHTKRPFRSGWNAWAGFILGMSAERL